MKNSNTPLLLVVGLLLIGNLFFGYMYFFGSNNHGSDPGLTGNFVRGNFPQEELTDSQIQSVTSFFESTTDITKITEYCNTQENRMLCFYYCRNVNQNHQYCTQLTQERQNFAPNSQQIQRLN